MRSMMHTRRAVCASILGLLSACASNSYRDKIQVSDRFEHAFQADASDLTSTGTNPFLDLRPGVILVLDGPQRLTITVLDETQEIDGVETRVVEERMTRDGWTSDVERICLAISGSTHDVYCFGRDVTYNGNTIVSHLGTWRAGDGDARPGLFMPATPVVGRRFQQEIAPGVTMRRCEVLATDAVVDTPGGKFSGCLRLEVTRPEQPEDVFTRIYAPGVGLVAEEEAWLDERGDLPADQQKLGRYDKPTKYLLVSRTPPFGGR
jgi:hypothetical protein